MLDTFESEYTVTPGRLVNIATYSVILLLLFICILPPFFAYYFENDLYIALLILAIDMAVMIPIIIGAWAYSPKIYSVSEKFVKIKRPAKDIIIPLAEIRKVEEKEVKLFKTIRLWANGGIFSMSGKFYNKLDGTFWMYAKNKNYVMIHAGEKWVISPDDKEIFIQDLKGKMERLKR
jgi:hypothetical protein